MSSIPRPWPTPKYPRLPLSDGDLANLRASGLTDATIRANGLYTESDPVKLGGLLNFSQWAECCRGGGLVFPYHSLEWTLIPFGRVRPLIQRVVDGKANKYEQPFRKEPRAYFPAGSVKALRDGSGDVYITEGEKKAMALCQAGLTAVGVGGVDCWKVKGKEELIPDLAALRLTGRTVYVVYDYDPKPTTRENVTRAKQRLAAVLLKAGAKLVLGVDLPPGPGGAKQGADDYLLAQGPETFRALVALARPVLAAGDAAKASKGKLTVCDMLLEVATGPGTELWNDADGEKTYATLRSEGRVEHLPVRSKAYRAHISYGTFLKYRVSPGTQTVQDVLNTLEGRAKHEGRRHPVFVRVAGDGGKLYLDLCDEAGRVAEVDADGWRVVIDPPVRFRRPKGMLALPAPEEGGAASDLRRFVNVTDAHWPLLAGWMVGALNPRGPYPLLKLLGEQGSSKSTTTRVVKSVIDPNVAPVRSAPKEERDLMIAAGNGWLLGFDNLSYVPPELSDAMCRLATGGGIARRTLYSDDEETILQAVRPVILNGIEDIGFRSDLLDRSVVVSLPRIEAKARRPEDTFWAEFEEARPRLLGVLLTAVSAAIKNLPAVKAAGGEWPRMADFAQWAVAAEGALGLETGEFLTAYEANRLEAGRGVLESSPVVTALRALLDRVHEFEGTVSQLLGKLAVGVDTRQKGWPGNARALAGVLARLAPNLRAAGIVVEQLGVRENQKLWRVSVAAEAEAAPVRNSLNTQPAPPVPADTPAPIRNPQRSQSACPELPASLTPLPSVVVKGLKKPGESLGDFLRRNLSHAQKRS